LSPTTTRLTEQWFGLPFQLDGRVGQWVVKLQGKKIIRFLVCFSIAVFLLAHPTVAKETTLTDFVFFFSI
jgi:hypothetical protein